VTIPTLYYGRAYPLHDVREAYDQRIDTTLRHGLFKAVDLRFTPQRSSTHQAAVLLCTALAYMKPPMVAPMISLK
jgi:hypothetical protein